MNPVLVGRLVAGVGSLIGIACAAYGVDQHSKRGREQAAARERLQTLEDALRSKEEELATLRPLLEVKNDQVRILAAELEMLRGEVDALRQPA